MTPRQHQGPRGGGESRGSLVAPDEIHPRDDVPCHGLQELRLQALGSDPRFRASRAAEARAAFARGLEVAAWPGDLQTKKGIEGFLRRLEKRRGTC